MANIQLASLDPIKKRGWIFKVSRYDEKGVLVIAFYNLFEYTSVKYFSDTTKAGEWIDTMVSYTAEIFPNQK